VRLVCGAVFFVCVRRVCCVVCVVWCVFCVFGVMCVFVCGLCVCCVCCVFRVCGVVCCLCVYAVVCVVWWWKTHREKENAEKSGLFFDMAVCWGIRRG